MRRSLPVVRVRGTLRFVPNLDGHELPDAVRSTASHPLGARRGSCAVRQDPHRTPRELHGPRVRHVRGPAGRAHRLGQLPQFIGRWCCDACQPPRAVSGFAAGGTPLVGPSRVPTESVSTCRASGVRVDPGIAAAARRLQMEPSVDPSPPVPYTALPCARSGSSRSSSASSPSPPSRARGSPWARRRRLRLQVLARLQPHLRGPARRRHRARLAAPQPGQRDADRTPPSGVGAGSPARAPDPHRRKKGRSMRVFGVRPC
jgi:hypothetical protein